MGLILLKLALWALAVCLVLASLAIAFDVLRVVFGVLHG